MKVAHEAEIADVLRDAKTRLGNCQAIIETHHQRTAEVELLQQARKDLEAARERDVQEVLAYKAAVGRIARKPCTHSCKADAQVKEALAAYEADVCAKADELERLKAQCVNQRIQADAALSKVM